MSAIATTDRRSNRSNRSSRNDRNNRRHLLAVPAARIPAAPRPQAHWSALVIRLAVAADENQLRRLAHMDSARPLSGQTLIAEQGGSVIAALSLPDSAVIADPFVATADAVAMLRLRAAQLGTATAA